MEQNKQEIPATFSNVELRLPDQEFGVIPVTNAEDFATHDEWVAQATGLGRVEAEPGDIDDFLNKSARTGTFVDITWHWVRETLIESNRLLAGAYLGKDPISGALKISRTSVAMVDAVTDKNVGEMFTTELVQSTRKAITKEDIEETVQNMFDDNAIASFNFTESVAEESLLSWEHSKTGSERNMHDPHVIKGADIASQIIASYKIAFGAQQLYINQLTDMLSEDANVGPFVERVQEIMALRRQGVNEYPGLLETLNTLITQQETEQETSSLEAAITRTGIFHESLADFTERMITGETPELHGNIPSEFSTLLNGVRMSYQALVGSGQMSKEAFVTAFTEQLGSIPHSKVWRDAHNTDSSMQARTQWRHLYRNIKHFERRGRLPDYLHTARQVHPQSSRKRRADTRYSRKKSAPTVAINELHDVATPVEEIVTPATTLSVMKSKNGGSEHAIERVDDLEALMEHALVTNFLKRMGNSGIEGDIRNILTQIQGLPTFYKTSKVIAERFTVDDEDCEPNRAYRLRRFKPVANTVDLSDPLARRIRVLYGIIPARAGSLLAFKTVTLRNEATY